MWGDSLGKAGLRSAQILLILSVAVISIYGLLQVKLVVIPLLLALILAAAIGPVVQWLHSKGWPSALATGTSFLLLLAVFGGVVAGIVVAIRSEMDTLVSQAVEGFDQLVAFAQNGPIPLDSTAIEDAKNAAVDFLTSSTVGNTALAGLSVATSIITGFLLMAVVLFFFLKDGEKIWGFFLRLFKGAQQDKARVAGYRTMEVLGGYVRGTALIALVDAVFIGGALFFLGVPLALPLAVIVFVSAFIPIVGATVASVLAALVALVANGPFVALMVIIVAIVVNQLEGNLLQPVVMGKSLSIHALVILLALTAGTILAGIIGAILAVPITAVAWAVIKVWTGEDEGTPEVRGKTKKFTDSDDSSDGGIKAAAKFAEAEVHQS
nr:AI-2E family transporter [Arthrobacter roseus]